MQRVRSIVWHSLVGGSIVLCLAVALLWWRSYSHIDNWFVIFYSEGYGRISTRRGMLIALLENPEPNQPWDRFRRISHNSVGETSLLPNALWPGGNLLHWERCDIRYEAVPPDYVHAVWQSVVASRQLDKEVRELELQLVMAQRDKLPDSVQQPLMTAYLSENSQYMAISRPMVPGVDSSHVRRQIRLPISYLLPCLLVLPSLWMLRTGRAWRRRSHQICVTCGYDLRATPTNVPNAEGL